MAVQGWQRIFEELKRRRVFRVATLYVVAFWPFIQIVDILSPALELPDSVMKYLVIAFMAGFPVALILAWIFDVNKDGVSVTGDDSGTPMIGSRSEYAVIGVLVALVAILFTVQYVTDSETAPVEQISEAAPVISDKSVAVLPFVTFGSEPGDAQFADGLTEELLNVLAKVKTLRVAARTSSFAYRGVNRDITEIGKELRVAYLLEGSIRRNDINDTVRITAQLIETDTGTHLFSNTYDFVFTDVFSIQDEIASAVVEELQITLLGDEKQVLLSRNSASPEAIAAYGVAQAELARRSEQSLTDAVRFYERAIQLDSQYADAYTGIATAHALNNSYGYTANPEAELEDAQQSLNRAFELEPESGNAWATQGLIYIQQKDKAAAQQALKQAMEYNPSHAYAVMWYAGLQESNEEKLQWYRKAYKLDPRSTVIGYNVANILFSQGKESEALEVYGQIMDADPHYHSAYYLAARISESRGRLDEAISQYAEAYDLSPSDQYSVQIAILYTDLGEYEKSWEWIGKIDKPADPKILSWVDWVKIAALTAEGREKEARPMLEAKITTANELVDSPFHQEDAAAAAHMMGNTSQVVQYFEKAPGEVTLKHLDNSNRIDATFAAAFAYKQRNEPVKAKAVIANLRSLMEAWESTDMRLGNHYWYQRSRLAVLEDEPRLALIHLQRAIDEGWRNHWIIEHEPIFAEMKSEPNFSRMIAGLETRMDIMREQLALASAFESDWSG